MLSYHNDQKVKDLYVARFEEHRAMDAVIQGEGYGADGRGCFVGCTLKNYDHSRFPVELGWPEWLAHLADKIFEGLPKEEAPQFGTDLLATVPVGKDLESVRHLLAIRRIDRLIELQKNCDIAGVLSSLKLVRDCHEAELKNDSCELIDWSAAWSAARSAESAAWSAESAWSAAESAASAARSAWSAAESAAWSAARAAESAAWSAARSAAYKQERDDLLDILRNL
jgi:hypothetical protein